MKKFLLVALATATLLGATATTSAAAAAAAATTETPTAATAASTATSDVYSVTYTIETRANRSGMNEAEFIFARRTALTTVVTTMAAVAATVTATEPQVNKPVIYWEHQKPVRTAAPLIKPQVPASQLERTYKRSGVQRDSYGTPRRVSPTRYMNKKAHKSTRIPLETELPPLPLEDRD